MAGFSGRLVRRSGLIGLSCLMATVLVTAAVDGLSTGTGLSAPVGADPSSSGSFARVEQPRRPLLPPPAAPGGDPTQVAIAWLQAYRTLRYDEPVDAWVDRVRPVVTPGLAATYEHGRAGGPGQDWQRWVARCCAGGAPGRRPWRGRRNKARRRGDGPRRETVGQLVPVSRHQRLLRVRDVDRARVAAAASDAKVRCARRAAAVSEMIGVRKIVGTGFGKIADTTLEVMLAGGPPPGYRVRARSQQKRRRDR